MLLYVFFLPSENSRLLLRMTADSYEQRGLILTTAFKLFRRNSILTDQQTEAVANGPAFQDAHLPVSDGLSQPY